MRAEFTVSPDCSEIKLTVDREEMPDWEFEVLPLGTNHIVAIAYGPLSAAHSPTTASEVPVSGLNDDERAIEFQELTYAQLLEPLIEDD